MRLGIYHFISVGEIFFAEMIPFRHILKTFKHFLRHQYDPTLCYQVKMKIMNEYLLSKKKQMNKAADRSPPEKWR